MESEITLTDQDIHTLYTLLMTSKSSRGTYDADMWMSLERILSWDVNKQTYRVTNRSEFLKLKLKHGF